MNGANIFEHKRREIYRELCQIGIEEHECQAEAKLILEHITGINIAQQIISDSNNWKIEWQEEIERILNLRQQRMPLAYCLGEVEFAGLTLKVRPGVLIPRVDTEILVETVLEWANKQGATEAALNLNIAEIGVGSGAIAISLLKRLPTCKVVGCDISEIAIATTKENAQRHGVADRLALVHADWKEVLLNNPNNFDVIVSNPPYIPLPANLSPTNSLETLQPELYFEPKEALFAGEDGLDFYRQFAQKLYGRCQFAAFEIGDTQGQAVLNIFKEQNWQNLQIRRDMNDLARVLIATI